MLLYDITSLESFEYLTNQAYTYALMCNEFMCVGERKECTFVLVGTKKDVVEKEGGREVDEDLAEQWAESQGMKNFEVTSFDKEEVQGAVCELLRGVRRCEKRRQVSGQVKGEESPSIQSKSSARDRVKRVFGRFKGGV